MSDNFKDLNLPDMSDGEAVLDTNLLISHRNEAAEFLRRIGNPKVFHTDITYDELYKHGKLHGGNRWEIIQQVSRTFEAFNSTKLSKPKKARKISRKISKILKRGGLQKETVKAEKNDTLIVAYAMIYGIDVLSKDALFHVMGKIFNTGINIYMIKKKKPDARSRQMKTILKKQGIQTPVDLTHLLGRPKKRRGKPKKRLPPKKDTAHPKEAEEK